MAKGGRLLAAGMALVLSVCAVAPSATTCPLRCSERSKAACCCQLRVQQTSGKHSCCQKEKASPHVCKCQHDQPQPTNLPNRNNSRQDRDWALQLADVAEVHISDLGRESRCSWSPLGFSYHFPPRWQSVACTWLF